MPNEPKKSPNLRLPLARFSYVQVFTPRLGQKPKPGEKARYSITGLILPPGNFKRPEVDKDLWATFTAEVMKFGKEKLGDKFMPLVKDNKVKLPMKRDIESKGYPSEFACYVRPWSYNAPGIVSRYRDPETGKPKAITDPNEVFSGAWGYITGRLFYTNHEDMNPSIGFMLANVQLWEKDERLDNRVAAQDEFDADMDAPAGMDLSSGGSDADALKDLLGA